MNLLRNSLIGAILVVVFLLITRWSDFQAEQIAASQQPQETLVSEVDIPSAPVSNSEINDELPQLPVVAVQDESVPQITQATRAELISVETDTVSVLIDTQGGDIVKVALKNYQTKKDQPDSQFVLLNRTEGHTYIAQSGLIGTNGTDKQGQRPLFTTAKTSYSLNHSDDSLHVDLYYQQDNVTITKRFTFSRDSYLIDVEYLVDNKSAQPWTATLYGQIKRDSYKPPSDMIGMQPYTGAAITTPETNYKKLSFDDLEDESFKVANHGGWVALVQHYFVSAWIPNQETQNNYNLRKSRGKDIYLLTFTSQSTTVNGNSTGSLKAQFYAGPKIIKNLEKISPFLDLTIDFSWLWFIAKPLFQGLDFLHGWVGNWGIAIILLTLCIKILFYYPSAVSYRSMAKMRKLQPMMADLKDKYGDDRQRMSAELMKLYKKEKVNPVSGCLPILLQMPVFIALYWTLMESVELRHAPFFLWITDLSTKDPYFILPVIMGVTMWIQQKLNPAPTDPMQAKIMQMMPLFFTALFIMFPAGLVLYWVVNNTLSIMQQYMITRQIEKS